MWCLPVRGGGSDDQPRDPTAICCWGITNCLLAPAVTVAVMASLCETVELGRSRRVRWLSLSLLNTDRFIQTSEDITEVGQVREDNECCVPQKFQHESDKWLAWNDLANYVVLKSSNSALLWDAHCLWKGEFYWITPRSPVRASTSL